MKRLKNILTFMLMGLLLSCSTAYRQTKTESPTQPNVHDYFYLEKSIPQFIDSLRKTGIDTIIEFSSSRDMGISTPEMDCTIFWKTADSIYSKNFTTGYSLEPVPSFYKIPITNEAPFNYLKENMDSIIQEKWVVPKSCYFEEIGFTVYFSGISFYKEACIDSVDTEPLASHGGNCAYNADTKIQLWIKLFNQCLKFYPEGFIEKNK